MRHVLLVFTLCFMGCGGSGEDAPPAAPAPQEPAAVVAPAADAAVLAEADLMDGAKDGIISQCGLCSLHMEGDAAHAVQVGDYTLHMCSAECKAAWEKDPVASLAILEEAVK
jgi:hypothetical protein